jgi:hypothetical protein
VWRLDDYMSRHEASQSTFKGLIVGRAYYPDSDCYNWEVMIVKRVKGQKFYERTRLVRIPGYSDCPDLDSFTMRIKSRREDILLG